MSRQRIFLWFFFGALLLLLYQLIQLMSIFFSPVLVAIVFCLVFYPVHQRILKFSSGRYPSLCAGVTTAVVVLAVILPLSFLAWILFREAEVIYPQLERLAGAVQNMSLPGDVGRAAWVELMREKTQFLWTLLRVDFRDILIKNLAGFSDSVASFGKVLAKNILVLILDFLVMVITLFFLFRDGKTLLEKIRDVIPMEPQHKEMILRRFYETISAVVRAAMANAAAQGSTAGLGFWLAGVSYPVFLGFLTGLFSFIPLAGAAAVWVPVTLYILFSGKWGAGVFLLIWGIGVVSVVDNIVKPYIIGERTRMPFLLLFFGIFGGLRVYGPIGVLLGPLLITLMLALIQIYKVEYQQRWASKPASE